MYANPLTFLIDRIETPIGELLLVADEAGKLRGVDWNDY
jgi:methylated-DNA-[protein]-cysteine S-methyltransferase